MPLNEHEQRIFDEIEKQLFDSDPKFQERVRKAAMGARGKRLQRLAAFLFVMGLVVMLVSFTRSALIAGLGFVLMVVSAGWVAMSIRSNRTERSSGSVDDWLDGFRQRWRRDR